MSHDHINAARAARARFDLSAPAGHVALVIATHCNDDGQAWPSIPTLAGETGYHRDTVERAVAELETHGLVVTRRPGLVTLYRIPESWAAAAAEPRGEAAGCLSTTPRPRRGVHPALPAVNPAARPRVPRGEAAGYPAARPRVTDKRTDQRTDAPPTSFQILARCPNRRGWGSFCDETCDRCRGSGHVHTDATRPTTESAQRQFRRRA